MSTHSYTKIYFYAILSVDTESDKPAGFIRPFGPTALTPQRQALGLVAECVNAKDKDGKTALAIAEEFNHKEVADILKKPEKKN